MLADLKTNNQVDKVKHRVSSGSLLLLSYTKLLITVIGAFSYTRLHIPDHGLSNPVWLLDANIQYSSGKLITLLLISILVALGYIVSFTLLISFGSLLQTKSNYWAFRWVNKVTPFLDAFYAPYTKNYRSWPGILLIVRLVIFHVSALYSNGDDIFKLTFIAINLFFLYAYYIILNIKYTAMSLHNKKKLDYLELFFLSNLTLYTVSMLYFETTNEIEKQQILSAIMLGSVFIVTCCIIGYQFYVSFVKSWGVMKRMSAFLSKLCGTWSTTINNIESSIKTESNSEAIPSVTQSTESWKNSRKRLTVTYGNLFLPYRIFVRMCVANSV